MEIKKLNNAISINTNQNEQNKVIEDLSSIKQYYGELTSFLVDQQTKHRLDELELCFVSELNGFLQFWQKVMDDFKLLTQNEMQKVLETNETLKKEFNELMEKTLGFTPQPDALFLNLYYIRKMAQKLKQ